jgi:hypothetical protein
MSREMNSNAIKLNDVKEYVKSNVMLQVAQLAAPRLAIQGAPGCGKSDLMRQICEENGWVLSVKYLSNMSLEQITGLPCKVENGSTAIWTKPELFNFNNPEYAPKGANDDTIKILLIDDFHLADRIMQKYLFQLLTYKSLNGYHLPKNTAIILAGNRNIDKAGANPIPAPVCNRMMFVEVKSEAEDWLKNFAMKHGVREDICTYIMNNSEGRLSSEPIETAAWASPRSWTYLSYQMDAYEKAFGKIDLDNLKIMASGLIGPENAAKFIEYHELFAKWDYNKLFDMSFKNASSEYAKEIKKNPTDAYAIIASGVSWVVEKYKKAGYNAADKDIGKSVDFLYDTMAFLLTYKDQSARRNIRPLIAAGCKFLWMWQQAADQNNNTKKSTGSLLSLIFNKMKQERDVDWLFYELIANVIDYKVSTEDQKKIAKAKENLSF